MMKEEDASYGKEGTGMRFYKKKTALLALAFAALSATAFAADGADSFSDVPKIIGATKRSTTSRRTASSRAMQTARSRATAR